jgi:hypothetical protein
MYFLLLIAVCSLPRFQVPATEEHVYAIELSQYWGPNGFGNNTQWVFWDWYDMREFLDRPGREMHVVDTASYCGEVPIPTRNGYLLQFDRYDGRRRVFARWFIESDTWHPDREPDDIDSDRFQYKCRRGLRKAIKRRRFFEVAKREITECDVHGE